MDTDRLETFMVFTMLLDLFFQFFGLCGGPNLGSLMHMDL